MLPPPAPKGVGGGRIVVRRRHPALALGRALMVALALALLACTRASEPERPEASEAGEAPDPGTPQLPPGAQLEMVEMLKADLDTPRHPSDGGGRAWLESPPDDPVRATVGTGGRFPLVFEVGPHGIAEGGMIFLQVSPFWGWSTPQDIDPEAPGYTRVSTDAQGVSLVPITLDQQLMGIEVRGRALEPGERVRIVYGAGPRGAFADNFAERGSRFWFAVDGDGDGVRQTLADSPAVDVAPGPPAQLAITLPSVARPGEQVRLALAVLDAWGSAGPALAGEVALEADGAGLSLPERIVFAAGDGARKTVEFEARDPGIYRVRGRGPDGIEGVSNPMLVAAAAPRIYWADLHGHSNLSDGTGTPEDYFRYARDVAALDVVALTDHDHWGVLFLDQQPQMWQEIRRQTQRFHEPGRFVTLLGYEWTSWIYGHRHVLYFADEGEVLSSMDPRTETPQQLWRALAGSPALTFAHHSAGGPIPTDWSIPPDPHFEPVTEIVSVHGSSESADTPGRIYSPVPGNTVRDALARGYRFGFIGSGDSHDGHPGLAHLAFPTGGLAALIADELTREGVLAALRARRVYATNGPRILLRASLAGRPMGATIELEPGADALAHAKLAALVVGTAPVERIDVIRSGEVVESASGFGQIEASLEGELDELRRGEYVYVRAVQEDGGAAWSSPIYIE